MGNFISRSYDKFTGKHDKEQAKKAAHYEASLLARAQEDQRRRREALDAARITRSGERSRERAYAPALGGNTILTGLLGLLGQAQGGAGARTLLGG